MGGVSPHLGLEANLARRGRAVVGVVLVVAALDWMGWATGIGGLTRFYRTWPQMVPWTALWLAGLAAAILVQTGQPPRGRVLAGRGLAVMVGTCAVAVLTEYVTGRSLGLDQVWFGDAMRTLQSSWPGRPSPLTASSVLLLATAVALTRVDHRWMCVVWSVCVWGAGAIACVSGLPYVFGEMSVVGLTTSTRLAIATAVAVLLLVVATFVARPDRPPLAWVFARPDGVALLRLYGLAVGFVIFVALSRRAFLALSCGQNAAFALSLAVGMVMALGGGLRLRQQEQSLLKDRADAEMDRATWAERIGAAIVDGRLLVYSQPIVDIATRSAVDEELLVRLRAVDTDEILLPSEFLPQCEQHGLMPVIDRYMVGRAIDLARTGRRVSVNISGDTIGDTTVMGEILEALQTAGSAVTGNIMFEITETIALASPAIAKAFSQGMRDLNCRVALDDFGTGYGTFTELRLLDLYALKIDQSFVKNLLHDHDDERVVNTISYVARTYGLTTVAEGVEMDETLDKLAELGIDRAQGYVLGKPKPVVW